MVTETEGLSWEAEFVPSATVNMLRDIRDNNSQTLGRTLSFYEVRNAAGEIILAAGVALWGFTRPPELWMMLAKPFTKRLRESLALTREGLRLPTSQYSGLIAECYKDDVASNRFVRALGWPEAGASLRPNSHLFNSYEVI